MYIENEVIKGSVSPCNTCPNNAKEYLKNDYHEIVCKNKKA